MRTTVDIPEPLLRRAKAEAALRGMKLKDFFTEAVRRALDGPEGRVVERAPDYEADDYEPGGDLQVVADGVTFPVARGPGGPAMRDLTPERIHRILEEEEVERALGREDSG